MNTNLDTFLKMIELFKEMDVPTSLNYYAEDAVYRYGSFPPVVVRQAIGEMTAISHLDFIEKMDFQIIQTWVDGDTVIAQMELPHRLKEGREITLPCTDIVRFNQEGQVKEFLVYIDSSPLFQNH